MCKYNNSSAVAICCDVFVLCAEKEKTCVRIGALFFSRHSSRTDIATAALIDSKQRNAEITIAPIYSQIAAAENKSDKILAISRYISFVGKSPAKKDAQRLIDRLEPYNFDSKDKVMQTLRKYVNGNSAIVETPGTMPLHGLYGLCGI